MSVLVFANCAQNEEVAPLTENKAVVSATMENNDSKSTATDEGYFAWATGDKIGIHTSEKGFLTGTLSGGATTPNGSFTYSYTGEAPTPTGYAVYPYHANHGIDGNTLSYHIPSVFELGAVSSNTNAAMLAVPVPGDARSSSVSYTFNHLAGVMRFVVKNAPAGTDRFTLSLGGKKINGTFSVSLEAAEPSITTGDAESGEGTTTLVFDDLASTQDLTLFVPVPVGVYTGISASLYDGEEVLGTWGAETANNVVARRSLKLMAPITFSSADGDIDNNVTVSSEAALKDAVQKTGTVTLEGNIALTDNIEIPENTEVVIDLNGNDLNNGSFTIEVAPGSTLSIVNNGEAVAVRSGSSTPSATITSTGDVITASENAVINIGEGVSLNSTVNCCIFVPSGADGVTINTAGDLKAGGEYATVYLNGNVTSGTINITGGSVTHDGDIAVYVAGKADVNISGGTIEGTTAVEIRAGNLTVTGGSLTATGDPFEADPNGNGSTSVGAAVAVCQHTTDHDIAVVISDGTFTGVRALYEEDLENETASDKISLSVTGGTFNGDVYSENCSAFIAGGKYSNPTACYYLADNANVAVEMTEDYTGAGFVTKAGQTVSLAMNQDVTYTVEKPLVGSAGTQNLGFQFLKGSTVSMTGGTVTSDDAKMLINNYSNLTLSNIVLAPTVPDTMNGQAYYVLSNNCGTVNINSGTKITAPIKDGHTVYAFDVCKYSSYPSVTVNVAEGVVVDGDVEYTGQGADQKLIINGGTFSGKLVVADAYKEGAKSGVSVKGGTFSDASWFDYLAAGADVSLGADLALDAALTFDKNATFNLNGCNLTNDKGDVFVVTAGTLTIEGNGTVWGSSDNSSSSCAVWAKENGNVVIKSGTYKVGDDESNKPTGNWRNDCIYARDNAKITVEGGEFMYTGVNELGHTFLLNCRDDDYRAGKCSITVKGGTFHKFNPGASNGENPVANYLADGYKSTEDGDTYVVTAVQE